MKSYSCNICHNIFESKKGCKNRTPKFCSNKCYSETLKKHKTCLSCGNDFVKWWRKKFCSKKCQSKFRKGKPLSAEWKEALSEGRKKSEKCKGKNLYNWKGGKETEAQRMKIASHKRRSLQKLLIDKIFLENLLKAQSNKCFFCECDLSNYKAIEHLTPLSRGGDNQIYNLVYSCKSCNSKKRNKTLEEYAIKTNNFHWIDKFDLIFSSSTVC